MNYSFKDLQCANIVLTNKCTKDRNGKYLFNKKFIRWAKRVKKHFDTIYSIARQCVGLWCVRIKLAFMIFLNKLKRQINSIVYISDSDTIESYGIMKVRRRKQTRMKCQK